MPLPPSKRQRPVNLFYLSGNTTGGWVTYTAHLMYGLAKVAPGLVKLYKVGNNTERKERSFGYGLSYRNVTLADALLIAKGDPTVIVALQKNYREQAAALIGAGAWLVVHDPAEFANLKLCASSKYITIRKAVTPQVPGATFVPHPYSRSCVGKVNTLEHNACSICRIDFDKHTEILLDANRLLPDKLKIQIRGFENRLYTRFKIVPKYPEWVQSVNHYPREREAAVAICGKSRYTVDMSLIKGDGGGTQYSFLEAMDAGSINIIHKDWVIPGDEMVPGANCLAVSNGAELAALLSKPLPNQRAIVEAGYKLLQRHESAVIAQKFYDLIWS